MKRITITDWCHQIVKNYAKKGDNCIDATAGKGKDTLFLCKLVGESGKVIAFDIQKQAVDMTNKLLEENNCSNIAKVYCDSHTNIEQYAKPDSVSVIMFNLGYLPGGNHFIATKYDTTISAIKASLNVLKPGGIISVCIYSGKDSGFLEKEKVLQFLKEIDSSRYLVIYSDFYNKPNNPPIPVFIIKL